MSDNTSGSHLSLLMVLALTLSVLALYVSARVVRAAVLDGEARSDGHPVLRSPHHG